VRNIEVAIEVLGVLLGREFDLGGAAGVFKRSVGVMGLVAQGLGPGAQVVVELHQAGLRLGLRRRNIAVRMAKQIAHAMTCTAKVRGSTDSSQAKYARVVCAEGSTPARPGGAGKGSVAGTGISFLTTLLTTLRHIILPQVLEKRFPST
jgi:hypothetical protein